MIIITRSNSVGSGEIHPNIYGEDDDQPIDSYLR
jgi:hypothetical protein